MAQRPGPGFRRLEDRATNTAPIRIAWLFGAGLGATGGVAFAAWETLVLRAAAVPLPEGDARWTALAADAAIGAVIGWIGAVVGLYGPRWATASVFVLAGWLLSPKLADLLASGGAPPLAGVVFGTATGVVFGQIAARLPAPGAAHQAFASVVFLSLALLVPTHLYLLAGATTAAALAVSGLALLVAAAFAGVTAAVTGEGRAPILSLLGALAVAGLGHAVLGLRARPLPAVTSENPPVVVVVVSGLRADRVGFLGYDRPTTPALDAVADTALVFEDAQATSNWTVPSLASILTGRLPYGHGAGLNGGSGTLGTPLRPDVRTLGRALVAGGMRTAAVVADPAFRGWALDTGFEEWMDDPGRGVVPSLLVPLSKGGVDPTGWPRRADADGVSDRAIAWVQTQPATGWFLLVQFADAGGPFTPTRADEEAAGYTTRPWPSDLYDASLRRVDRAVGRLLDALPPGTRVVVTGDRGVQLGEQRAPATQGRVGARFGHTMFVELLHVPLIVRVPGLSPGRVREVVSLVDLAPTVLQLASLPPIHGADGQVLERVFGTEHTDRVVIAQSALFGPEQQVAILGGHKLVLGSDGRSPVYDREADPQEVSPQSASGARNDRVERQLRTVLPPSGAGAELATRPSLAVEVGQFVTLLAKGRR